MKTWSYGLWLAVSAGLISGFASLLMSGEYLSFGMFAVISIAAASILGFVRPPFTWSWAVVASLGFPAVLIVRLVYETAIGGTLGNLLPLAVMIAIVLGFFFAYAGVSIGVGLRSLLKKPDAGSEWLASRSLQKVVITVPILMAVAIGVYVVLFVEPELPLTVGIRTGEGLFQKSLLVSRPEIGAVTSIRILKSQSDTVATILACGKQGAMSFSLGGDSLSFVKFDERVGKVEPIDVDGDGVFEYMNRGGGWQPVSLISSAGATLWKREGAPDDMAAIDLNGDDTLEFAVGFNAGGGLKALDARGKELWSVSASNVFSVAAVDVDEDGSAEIVHTDGESVTIRKADGHVMRKFNASIATFAVCPWSDDGQRQVLLHVSDRAISAFDFEGKPVGSYSIPLGGIDLAAAPATFDGSSFYAVSVQRRATSHLSMLYVFDQRDSVIYHEVFNGQDPSVAVIPNGDESGDVLLVGGAEGTVSEYRWKAARSGP